MRLRERDKVTVTVKMPDNETNDDQTYRFKGGIPLRVVLRPLSGEAEAKLFGQSVSRLRLLMYDGKTELKEGMGVCVAADKDAPCDYRITRLEKWSLQSAIIEEIDEAMRA